MKSSVWRGTHSHELLSQIAQAWERSELLFVGPPTMLEVPKLDEKVWRDKPQPVLAVLTSGTTASPRFVFYSKKNIESALEGIVSLFDESRIDTIFCYPQPFHTFGLTLGYVLAMLKGWRLVTAPGKYSREAHARAELSSEGVLTLGTPVHFKDLHKYTCERNITLAPSYSAIIGGAPVAVDLWNMLKSSLNIAAPSIGYGCTEASPGLTHLPPGEAPTADNQIGYVLPNVKMEQRPGVGFEFQGPNACLAMEQNGELVFSDKILIRDHIVSDERGVWSFRGRYDLVINCGGLKISLEAVEKEIQRRLNVECLCFAFPDERLGQELGVIVNSPEPVDLAAFIKVVEEHFQKRISARNILITSALPLSVNGKVDRREALRWLQDAQQLPVKVDLPIAVEKLSAAMPHRAPMIWVDEVLAASSGTGECRVSLKSDAHYMTAGVLRKTALIEFIAQSYGYVRSVQSVNKLIAHAPRPKRAFLVGTRDTRYFMEHNDSRLSAGAELHIRISDIRELKPFVLYKGEVCTPSGDVLMSTQMKLFHE